VPGRRLFTPHCTRTKTVKEQQMAHKSKSNDEKTEDLILALLFIGCDKGGCFSLICFEDCFKEKATQLIGVLLEMKYILFREEKYYFTEAGWQRFARVNA
jgi:hypothetical protein